MKKFLKLVKNLMFPRNLKCIVCQKELNSESHFSMCDACMEKLPRNFGRTCLKCGESIANTESQYCLRCKQEKPLFTRCFSPLQYKHPVTYLIREFKYNNKQYLSETLGNFLVESYVVNNLNCDLVLPVPLHEKRLKKRGYNQALLLANQLNEKLGLPIREDALIKTKDTLTQTSLNKDQRKENVLDAFFVPNKSLIENKVVLVIDDVYTTGSTLNECALALFEGGAKKVYCLTLAHTMPSFKK